MFKVGDFVILKNDGSHFIVTRVYNERYMAIGTYDVLDGMIFYENIVKQKYFSLVNLDDICLPGVTFRQLLDIFTDSCLKKDENGNYTLIETEGMRNGIGPRYGLPADQFDGFTAVE